MEYTTPPPTSVKPEKPKANQEELNKIEVEKKKAELRKAEAEADAKEADALKAKWIYSEAKGLEGKIEVEVKAGYYAEVLAYKAIESIAVKLAKAIDDSSLEEGKLIIIGKEDFIAQAALWQQIDLTLEMTISQINKSIDIYEPSEVRTFGTPGPSAIIPAGIGIVKAAAEIASFFKTKSKITTREVVLNEKALNASVANQIHNLKPKLTIIIPELCLNPQGKLYAKFIDLISKIGKLKKIRNDIYTEPETIQQSDVGMQQKESIPSIKQGIITKIDAEIAAAQTMVKTLTTKEANNPSPLESVISIDLIKKYEQAKVLKLIIASQGGEVETTESSFSKGRISYLGGAVISYFLSDINGFYIQSGNIQEYKTATYVRKNGVTTLQNR